MTEIEKSTTIDLSGEDDVYASSQRGYRWNSGCGPHDIRIVSEAVPTALPRLFGLLSGLSVMPESTSSLLQGDNTVILSIHFDRIAPSTIDLLRRKILQLPETVEVAG